MLTGQCYCGAIQYEVSGAMFNKSICHCTMCRGTTGAPCVAWFTVAPGDFRLVQGRPVQYRSSAQASRGFCGTCGTQLTFADDALPDELDVTICRLHEAARFAPDDHTYMGSALPWMTPGDRLPRYRRNRGAGDLVQAPGTD